MLEGSTVFYQCNFGFGPQGILTAVCTANGSWIPDPAHVTCRKLGIVMHVHSELLVVNSRISFMVSQMERWFSVTNLKSDTFVNFFFTPHHEWSIHCRRMSKICQKFPIQVGARELFILSWKGIGSVCDFPHSLTSWLWFSCHSTKWISGELYRHNRGFRGILQLWSTYGSRGEDESCVHCEWVVFKPCQLKLHYRYVKIPSYTINSSSLWHTKTELNTLDHTHLF